MEFNERINVIFSPLLDNSVESTRYEYLKYNMLTITVYIHLHKGQRRSVKYQNYKCVKRVKCEAFISSSPEH